MQILLYNARTRPRNKHIENHLEKEHKIDIKDRNELKQAIYNKDVVTASSRQPALDEDRKKRQLTEHRTRSIDKKTLEYLYTRWIITLVPFFS